MELFFTQIDPPALEAMAALSAQGWKPHHLPFREVHHLDQVDLKDLAPFKLIVMTSKNAARWFLKRQFPKPWPPFALVGASTAQCLGSDSVNLFLPPAPHSEALVAELRRRTSPEDPILFLHGTRVSPHLPNGLHGYNLIQCTVYETIKIVPNRALRPASGVVYFQAPSSVEDFVEFYGYCPERVAAIGPSTRKRIEQEGWQVDFQPSRPELEVFLRELPHHTYFKG